MAICVEPIHSGDVPGNIRTVMSVWMIRLFTKKTLLSVTAAVRPCVRAVRRKLIHHVKNVNKHTVEIVERIMNVNDFVVGAIRIYHKN
jgi:hypothetical protein